MEEDEYRFTYDELTSIRCVFEKALTNHQAKCSLSQHFCLADREGYACKNAESSLKCVEFLKLLRENSIFVLKLHEIDGPLPHNMEIRVQAGGLAGLAKLLETKAKLLPGPELTEDIQQIVDLAQKEFGQLQNLPYSKIIQSVVQFQGRRRRQR